MITVDRATSAVDRADCLEIRRVVFVEEQAVPLADELDGLDDEAEHLLARVDGIPAGTARLRLLGDVAKGERLAVLVPFRRHRLGVALMEALERRARELRAHTLKGAAQVQALSFYEALGYQAEGEVFLDAGIAHRAIRKTL